MKRYRTHSSSSSLVAAATVALLSGCATVTQDKSDTISVSTPGCPTDTYCTFSNKKGQWQVRPPATLTIPKSDDALKVECKSPDGRTASAQMESSLGGMFWGNILFGGAIGMIADAHTDAHREYGSSIVIPLCR